MQKHSDKFFKNKPAKPNAGLFDKIISAIKREKETKQTRKILLAFLCLLAISVVSLPFSWSVFTEQWRASRVAYYMSTAFVNFNVFPVLWQNFTLSVLESLPIMAITLFAVNLALAVFTLRLFLHKKQLLFRYFVNGLI